MWFNRARLAHEESNRELRIQLDTSRNMRIELKQLVRAQRVEYDELHIAYNEQRAELEKLRWEVLDLRTENFKLKEELN